MNYSIREIVKVIQTEEILEFINLNTDNRNRIDTIITELKKANIQHKFAKHHASYYRFPDNINEDYGVIGEIFPFTYIRHSSFYVLIPDFSVSPILYLNIRDSFEKYCFQKHYRNIEIQFGQTPSYQIWQEYKTLRAEVVIRNQFTLNKFTEWLIENANYLKMKTL